MRSFQHTHTLDPVPGDVVAILRRIDRIAGAERHYEDQLPQLLGALRTRARVESITASSAIEGVIVSNARVPSLVSGTVAEFRNRSEAEFAGYTGALNYLNQQTPGEISVGLIQHLHRLLYEFTDVPGGSFKLTDNLVVDRLPNGSRAVRFAPVGALDSHLS